MALREAEVPVGINHIFNIRIPGLHWPVVAVFAKSMVKAFIEDGKDVRLGDWKAADVEILNTFQLLTAKPVVYLALMMDINKWDEVVFGNVVICNAWILKLILWLGALNKQGLDLRSEMEERYRRAAYLQEISWRYQQDQYRWCLVPEAIEKEEKCTGEAFWKVISPVLLNLGRDKVLATDAFDLHVGSRIGNKVNMNEKIIKKKNKFLPKIHAWVQDHGGETIIPFSCALERNLADMPEDEAAKILAGGLMIRAVYGNEDIVKKGQQQQGIEMSEARERESMRARAMAMREITQTEKQRKRQGNCFGVESKRGVSSRVRLGLASVRLFLEGLDQCVKNGKGDKWEKGWREKGESYSMGSRRRESGKARVVDGECLGAEGKLGLAWMEEGQVLLEFEFVEEARRVLTSGKRSWVGFR
ncbi:Obg-like ATPase 1 [Vitis vinifera]|uniref:Obg-like ATPase 1 n=1 Tax=Vitis vinifera TaxID=29760 RepID=A0A438D5Y1_VITVI|nr:Obg-like ATPase 1 [Vitis vinifera]